MKASELGNIHVTLYKRIEKNHGFSPLTLSVMRPSILKDD